MLERGLIGPGAEFVMPRLRSRLHQSCARVRGLGSDERGAVAIMFALALVPLTLMVGAALDYSGASNLRTHLQVATDGTNLKLCQIPGTPTQAVLEDTAKKSMTSYLGSTTYKIDALKPTTNPRQIELTTSSTFSTAILRGFGHQTVPVAAQAKCFGEPQTFEIALVVDTTYSMATAHAGQSKLQSLKTAATDFVNFIYDHPVMSKQTKMSFVPFSAGVAVSPTASRAAAWTDQSGAASYHWSGMKGGAAGKPSGAVNRFFLYNKLKAVQANFDWKGCFEALPYPLNTQDAAPVSSNPNSYFVPMLAPDESGDGGQIVHKDSSNKDVYTYNSYINDANTSGNGGSCNATSNETDRTGRSCKYSPPTNLQDDWITFTNMGPNFACNSRPLTRMTTSRSTLLSEITQLNAAGNTNIHEGVMWGWRTISPKSIFATDAAAYDKKYNNKIIVLMTDGMNTWNTPAGYNPLLKSFYSAYGFVKNPDGTTPNSRLPPGNANPSNDDQTRAAMDVMTLQACQNARAAPNNVVIYTVAFSVPNDPIDQKGLDLMKNCAGSTTRAFVASSGNELVTAFQQIAQDIGGLRLTN